MTPSDMEKSAPFDDVDFTSGFETQHELEYRPLRKNVTVPAAQAANTLWYRDLHTILMMVFLASVFLFGTVLLTKMVFTSNPLYVLAVTVTYVILAMALIILEVKSIHVR